MKIPVVAPDISKRQKFRPSKNPNPNDADDDTKENYEMVK
jgi:hypothetical protein